MAKTLFGALIVDARNKVGGHVLSKNKGGSFIRRKVSPIQPRSGAQRLIRGIVTELSRAWGGVLDDTKRGLWTEFAKGHPTKDVFGQNVILTGMQMYVRLNTVIVFHGGTLIDTPPLDLSVSAITDFTPSADTSPLEFLLAGVLPASLAADEIYAIWATKQVGVGKNALSSLMTFLCQRTDLSSIVATIVAPATGAIRAANVVTITTTAPHGLTPGDLVTIQGVADASFDGEFLVASSATTTTFTYTQVGPGATSGNGSVHGSYDIVTEYEAKFGALSAGTHIGVGIRAVNTVTGAESPVLSKNITVA